MFQNIVVATDFSPAGFAVLKCLSELKAFGCEKCLLLRCLTLQETASVALSYTTAVVRGILQSQKEILENQGFEVETRIVPGMIKKAIRDISLEDEYSAIVVGAQAHTMVSEFAFGSLAYDLVHYAQKPVLLVRVDDPNGEGLACPVGCDFGNHILFPTDFSENADAAFEYVQQMVAAGAKKVTLVHVQDQSIVSPYLTDRLDEFNRIDDNRLQILKETLHKHGNVEIDTLIKYGSPAVEILKLVKELDVKLVAMGSQGRGFVKELFLGSVSHNIGRMSAASVLLIPARRKIGQK